MHLEFAPQQPAWIIGYLAQPIFHRLAFFFAERLWILFKQLLVLGILVLIAGLLLIGFAGLFLRGFAFLIRLRVRLLI